MTIKMMEEDEEKKHNELEGRRSGARGSQDHLEEQEHKEQEAEAEDDEDEDVSQGFESRTLTSRNLDRVHQLQSTQTLLYSGRI